MKNINTTSLISLFVIIACFTILSILLLFNVRATDSMQTQIVQMISGILMLVLTFYFGATHKQNIIDKPNQNNKMYQIFWDIKSLDDVITDIDGNPVSIKVSDLPNQDKRFQIVKDDTNTDVLVVETENSVILTLNAANNTTYTSVSVVSDYIGGRPPHRII